MNTSDWVAGRADALRNELAELVAISSVSTDGQHRAEIERAAEVDVEPRGNVVPWRTDPRGAAFDAAMRALQASIGCGGSIGFVGPACDLLGGVPALLLGIEDPQGNAHAPDESLHEGDFHKLIASLAALLENLAAVPARDVEREELNRG